jgi:hypothetical protein
MIRFTTSALVRAAEQILAGWTDRIGTQADAQREAKAAGQRLIDETPARFETKSDLVPFHASDVRTFWQHLTDDIADAIDPPIGSTLRFHDKPVYRPPTGDPFGDEP